MNARTVALGTLGVGFIAAGLNHFLNPRPYLTMMPPWVPEPQKANVAAGIAEIAGGVGLLVPPLRQPAGLGLLALLAAVFPANVQVAQHGWPGVDLPRWTLWARLPVQPVLMAAVYWAAIRSPTAAERAEREVKA